MPRAARGSSAGGSSTAALSAFGPKPVDRHTPSYQFRPHPVGRPGPRRPREHRRVERNRQRVAERLERGLRLAQNLAGVDDRPAELPEDPHLLFQAEADRQRPDRTRA
jgi:hypothetical protein